MASIPIDEARLLLAGLAMHGFISSPQVYKDEEIVNGSVALADAVLKKLQQPTGDPK